MMPQRMVVMGAHRTAPGARCPAKAKAKAASCGSQVLSCETMKTLVRVLSCLAVTVLGCGGDGGAGAPGPATSGGCNFNLTVDGATYNAISCTAQGDKTFASGVYQIVLSAPSNRAPTPVRSVAFVLTDSDLATESHVKTFTVGAGNPGASGTYSVTPMDMWGTLEAMTNVGSGSLAVT